MRAINARQTGGRQVHVPVWMISLLCVAISVLTEGVSAQTTPLDEEPSTDTKVAAPAGAPTSSDTKATDTEPEDEDTETAAGKAESRENIAAKPAAAASAVAPNNAPPPNAPIASPPPASPSPFEFSLTGAVGGTLFAQDTPSIYGSGIGALLGPYKTSVDGWIMGGDVRQTRLIFNVRGPMVIGAIPLAAVEFEMTGGEEIHSVPGGTTTVKVVDATGNTVGTAKVPSVFTTPQGDESLLPRLRTAYVELNWDAGENIVRVGQYHNLMFGMIAASGAHPATMGYMAGQLGWREPGVTYSHKFKLSEATSLYAAAQVNRNSWNDNAVICSTTSVPPEAPPAVNCLPYGVSLGEAGLPQFEARVLLSSGRAESPWPQYYAPTVWQLYLVGHWDQKDLSGVGNEATAPARDTMQTFAVQGGGKVKLGPVMVAANGWYGQNAGSLYGHMFQMQAPDKPDVTGFGAWGQVAFSFTKNISLWVFGGIDQPNRDEAIAAGFYFLRNIKLDAMLAYLNGPLAITLEFYHFITTTYRPAIPAAAIPALESTNHANQPSVTVVYMF